MTHPSRSITSNSPIELTLPPAGSFAVDESLLERARALGPMIREHADTTERDRRLARPVIDAMRDAGLFRMFTPRALGGLEADPVTVARVVEEVSGFDSAAGWALQAGSSGSWWTSNLPAEGVAELFADGPDLLMSASFAPPHRAEEVPGGYLFSGRGPLASTIHDSPWVMMTAMVFDGEQPRMTPFGPEIVGLIMRTSDVEIVDTWHSLGMRGTDSNDVAASGVFIPTARSFHVMPEFERGSQFRGPLYQVSALVPTFAIIAPVALAIARGALTELRELAGRKTPLGARKTLKDRTAAQAALAEGEAVLRAARLFFYDELAAAWQRAATGQRATLQQKADMMLASTHAVQSTAKVADLVHRMAGTSGIYARNRLERHFRDAQTVRQHGFLCESRLETVGQVYLGVEPEFGFVVF
ncbi:MAG TPA: acyl-CoA dehydrogenase family protein [Gemmatimonadaceae bacterium]|nr:acyl-CoA dehydrogenase family protein [Gemmatimonadaceae bacterium]